MKTDHNIQLIAALFLLPVAVCAQTFDSGSDGSYGPLNVTSNTVLDLPPDGIFRCTTITVTNGRTLSFRRNPLNTPVYLLATGDVTISGVIDVRGKDGLLGVRGEGGPGGFDGGWPANGPGFLPGDGLGPGRGIGSNNGDTGFGAYGLTTSGNPKNGQAYGNTLIVPLVGGSGGGGGFSSGQYYGGGGGGGAVLVASDTRVVINSGSTITAQGGIANHSGIGSGGAIRIVAPIVSGSGSLEARSASGHTVFGIGRIRIDATNRFGLSLAVSSAYSIGKYMHVFPLLPSRLDIIQAAGTNIAEGASMPVRVQLPEGALTNQVVTVQARDFIGVVPITVEVTPDSAPSIRYNTAIDMAGGNLAQTNVPVVIPAGTSCRIYAWTR